MESANTLINEMNIPRRSVQEMIETLVYRIVRVVQSGSEIRKIPAVFLWGTSGIGKTEGVYEIAEEIEKATGKKVVVTVVHLQYFSPTDVKGMPVKIEVKARQDEEKRYLVEWIRPKIFDMDPSEDIINLMFLDELSAIESKSIQLAACEIAQDRTAGEHKLPDNTIIIAAGNRISDRCIAFETPRSLNNRMAHFQIIADVDSWHKWAVRNMIHPLVKGYLSYSPSMLLCEPKNRNVPAYPSPRSWKKTSDVLYDCGINDNTKIPNVVRNWVESCIGVGAAIEFLAWCDTYRSIPSAQNICEGCRAPYPNKQDALYALVSSLVSHVARKENTEEGVSRAELDNLSRYVERFPADFLALLYSDLLEIPGLDKKLIMIPSFREWMNRTRR